MKEVTLDLHSGESQLHAVGEDGTVLLSMQVPTTKEDLRRVVAGIPGPKRVIFEEGPLSGIVRDALRDVADEIVSADPTRNALVSRSENSSDERDAERLGILSRAGAIHPVYVPDEPHRTFRSTVHYDHGLAKAITVVKNQIKALCRRHLEPCKGHGVYRSAGRRRAARALPNAALRWQMESLGRRLDLLRTERVVSHRLLGRLGREMPAVKKLQTIPGVGPVVAPTIAAWIVDPARFHSRNQVNSYAGLGLGQGFTNWKPVGRAKASKRGQRHLKWALFIAAKAAVRGVNAISKRYQSRMAAGWPYDKAIRDAARTILYVACAIMRTGKEYDDGRVNVPVKTDDGR
jgi:transposase